MSPQDIKAPTITSKQKRQLIDYNKFPSSFASMARKTFSNLGRSEMFGVRRGEIAT